MRIIVLKTGPCGLLGGEPGEKCFAPTVSDDAMVPKFHTIVILRVVAEPTSAVLGVLDPATAQSLAQDDVFLGGRGRIGPCGSSGGEPGHADYWVEDRAKNVSPLRDWIVRCFSDPIHLKNPAVSWFKTKKGPPAAYWPFFCFVFF